MERKTGTDDKKGKAKKKPTSKSGTLRAGSAVAEYMSAAEAAATVAAAVAVPGGAAAGTTSGRRRKKLAAASRASRRETSENGISRGGEDTEVSSNGMDNALDDIDSTQASSLGNTDTSNKNNAGQEPTSGAVAAADKRISDKTTQSSRDENVKDSAGPGSSLLVAKVAIAERSEQRRNNKGDAADAEATKTDDGNIILSAELDVDARALPGSAADRVPDELPQSGTAEQQEDDDDRDNISIVQEELSKSQPSIEYGNGSYSVSEIASGTAKSGDSSRQGLDLQRSMEASTGGNRFSRRALVEAVLVDEDEISRRAYAKAALDVRQQMREMAVSAREVVVLPKEHEEGNAAGGGDAVPSSCWRRRRRLWIAVIVGIVVVSVVVGCVFGIAKPGASSTCA
jgi:hypothetical protein